MKRSDELFNRTIKYNLERIMFQEQIETGDHMKCDICGREVTINVRGKGHLICCNEPMIKVKR
ncbi:MAG: hypothetical protein ACTSVB_01325 [Candidatus Heimdallarchaeaceae archaeon]